jgi:hypothetical protein
MQGGHYALILAIIYFLGYMSYDLARWIPNPFIEVKYRIDAESLCVERKALRGWIYVAERDHFCLRLQHYEPANTMFKNGLTLKDVLSYYDL